MLISGWRVGWPLCAAGGARALFCAAGLGQACASGLFSVEQLAYLRASAHSRDARDLVWQRAAAKMCASTPRDTFAAASIEATRKLNNALLHALDVGDGAALESAMRAVAAAERGRK
jgi:hypothetical protein